MVLRFVVVDGVVALVVVVVDLLVVLLVVLRVVVVVEGVVGRGGVNLVVGDSLGVEDVDGVEEGSLVVLLEGNWTTSTSSGASGSPLSTSYCTSLFGEATEGFPKERVE